MEMVMTVSVAIIAACMFFIMMAAVAVLLRIRKLTMEAERLVETVRLHLPPLIHDVTKITSDVRSIVHTVERQAPKLGDAFEAIRVTARDVQGFERMLRERLERPLLDLTALISGLVRAVVSFWRTLIH
ncbi:MAG: hypothetical protein ONB44_10655 [candidate division KSB1 bacterium]|nr:hypothetical protein [candidate division KSB1 bacterium]MDZ7302584.1 hypothetical protein [candidate division KSB1 bacterium]MDZ7311575.1 hypothetical protein [candidate division KSB1 bacterium]